MFLCCRFDKILRYQILKIAVRKYMERTNSMFAQNPFKIQTNLRITSHTWLEAEWPELNIFERRVEYRFLFPDAGFAVVAVFYWEESLPTSSDYIEIVFPSSKITTYLNGKWQFLMSSQKFPDQFYEMVPWKFCVVVTCCFGYRVFHQTSV